MTMQKTLSRSEDERLKCLIVYEESANGSNPYRCSLAAGVTADTATRWLRNPQKYDPVLDEVALRRAMEGDRDVWAHLTVWELTEIYRRLNEIKSRMFDFEWCDYVEALRKSLGHKDSTSINRGMRKVRAG